MIDKKIEKYLEQQEDSINELKIPFTNMHLVEVSDMFDFLPGILEEVKNLKNNLKKANDGGDALDYFKRYHTNLTKKYVRSNEDFEKLIIEGFIKSALLQVQRITAIMKDARKAFTDDDD